MDTPVAPPIGSRWLVRGRAFKDVYASREFVVISEPYLTSNPPYVESIPFTSSQDIRWCHQVQAVWADTQEIRLGTDWIMGCERVGG